jgi:hypothetical protein
MRTTLLVALSLVALACRSHESHDSERTTPHDDTHDGIEEHFEEPSDPWTDAHVGTSAAGTYELRWRATTGEIPLNEGFGLEVWVFEPGGAQPLEDVRLRVDAAMPGHGHGMNRVPVVTRGEGGRFFVEGLLFHMTGQWALYLDVGRGAVTERAEFEIELE